MNQKPNEGLRPTPKGSALVSSVGDVAENVPGDGAETTTDLRAASTETAAPLKTDKNFPEEPHGFAGNSAVEPGQTKGETGPGSAGSGYAGTAVFSPFAPPSSYAPVPSTACGPVSGGGVPGAGQSPIGVGYGPAYTAPPRPKRSYSPAEGVLACLFLVLGWWFIHAALTQTPGVGALLYEAAFLGLSACLFRRSGRPPRAADTVFAAVLLLLSGALVWQNSTVLSPVCEIFLTAGNALWCLSRCRAQPLFGARWGIGLLTMLFVTPFAHMGSIFGAVAGLGKRKNSREVRLPGILLGLLAALIPTCAVAAVLYHADTAFRELLRRLSGYVSDSVGTFLWQALLGIPTAMYLFGRVYGARYDEKLSLTPDAAPRPAGGIPAYVFCAALTPLCLLYTLFFAAQSAYYWSAFQNLLPAGFGYADYAREGFFRLCLVAVFNGALMLLLRYAVRREPGCPLPLSARIYGTLLSAATLLLTATALRKMVLYVSRFGLTRARTYTVVFMLWLTVLFAALIVALWRRRVVSVGRIGAVTAFLLLGVMLFGNADGVIAATNTRRYQAGTLSTVDVAHLYSLGDAGVPYLVQLAEREDDVSGEARVFLEMVSYEKKRHPASWLSLNRSALRAQKALSNHFAVFGHLTAAEMKEGYARYVSEEDFGWPCEEEENGCPGRGNGDGFYDGDEKEEEYSGAV